MKVFASSKLFSMLLWCLLGTGLISDVSGCRYNVRETGFVDFGLDQYSLVVRLDETESLFSDSDLKSLEALLSDSNIILDTKAFISTQLIPPGAEPIILLSPREDHPPLNLVPGYPRTNLESKTDGDERSSFMLSLMSVVKTAVTSPLRELLVKKVSENYAVVLFIDGADDTQNKAAYNSISRAVQRITNHLDYLPKPIERGPVILSINQKARTIERVLLWSLGIDEITRNEPTAAIIYGKVRWIGSLMHGSEITEEFVFQVLSIIGADCECGIDPRLLRGTPLPVRWGKEIQTQLVQEIGFDPENPLVMTEVSQILRLRSRLFSDLTPIRMNSSSLDDLPVPFVEDRVASERRDSPFLWLLYLCGIAASIVVLVGILLLVRARLQ